VSNNAPGSHCRAIADILRVLFVVGMWTSEGSHFLQLDHIHYLIVSISTALLTLRVWAIWGRNKKLGITLLVLFVVCGGSMFVLVGVSAVKIAQNGAYRLLCYFNFSHNIFEGILLKSFHNTCLMQEPIALTAAATGIILLYDSSKSVRPRLYLVPLCDGWISSVRVDGLSRVVYM
jgi:hypothetical protein